ncbi:MAG: hypothetical protein DRQ06_00280 [Candidatus Hydrothermota bacterium]|nr:MAG: hypothetical protein DRQ06_00280 [Candidatus Hydrothermae bacterium]
MNDKIAEQISKTYDIDLKIARILVDKGVTNLDLARATFNPVLENLLPPETLPDFKAALEKILKAVGKEEKILIWGHEDADGITSTCALMKAIEKLGGLVDYFIPAKSSDGHGLSKQGIDMAIEEGVKLIVTVDCGGGSGKEAEYALSKGVDVVVTDHHELPKELPPTPFVNPKMGGGSFPYLAGVGVAFKMAWGILRYKSGWDLYRIRKELPELFFYAYVGTIADRVPLFSENRIFLLEGEKVLSWYRHPLVKAYKNLKGEDPTPEIVISLASAGKTTGRRNLGVELYKASDEADAEIPLKEILKEIEYWTAESERLLKEAQSRIKIVRNYILLDMGEVKPRFLGFLSSRLKDKYNVPTIVLGRKDNGQVAAEVRAPYGFNSLDLLDHLSDIFIDYGGHKLASGFSMDPRQLPELVEEVELYFKEKGNSLYNFSADIILSEKDRKILEDLVKVGQLGVEIRALFKKIKLQKVKELLMGLPVVDPLGLLDLYGPQETVNLLLLSTDQGIAVEQVQLCQPSYDRNPVD